MKITLGEIATNKYKKMEFPWEKLLTYISCTFPKTFEKVFHLWRLMLLLGHCCVLITSLSCQFYPDLQPLFRESQFVYVHTWNISTLFNQELFENASEMVKNKTVFSKNWGWKKNMFQTGGSVGSTSTLWSIPIPQPMKQMASILKFSSKKSQRTWKV